MDIDLGLKAPNLVAALFAHFLRSFIVILLHMTHKSKAVILRTVKYGETSLIVTMFTELFGIQSYMVKGVRSGSKSAAGKISFFQPAALLDLEVYHNPFKTLQ